MGLFVPLGDIVMLRGSNELCNLSHSVLVSFRERERERKLSVKMYRKADVEREADRRVYMICLR